MLELFSVIDLWKKERIVTLLSDELTACVVLKAQCNCPSNLEVLMANPTLLILSGPAQRDLEQAFTARNLGAMAKFSIAFDDSLKPEIIGLRILNFSFVTCHGQKYEIGGQLAHATSATREKLPPFNFIFVHYDAEARIGNMEFSNAE